jgi:hypothetical protein
LGVAGQAVLHTLNLRLHPDEIAFVNDVDDRGVLVDESLSRRSREGSRFMVQGSRFWFKVRDAGVSWDVAGLLSAIRSLPCPGRR